MCARSGVELTPEELEQYFGEVRITPRIGAWRPRDDFWPGQDILVVRDLPGQGRVAESARWGLAPAWWAAVDGPGGDKKPYPTYLARVETAATTPTWRDAWAQRPGAGRCLVLFSHWHEWTGSKGNKRLVRLSVPGHRLVASAGLWADFHGQLTAALITCPPAEDIAWVHDRMPAILHPSAWDAWLSGQAGQDLVGPPPPGIVRAVEVAADEP